MDDCYKCNNGVKTDKKERTLYNFIYIEFKIRRINLWYKNIRILVTVEG